MERQNLRLNPSYFQDFSMAGTFHPGAGDGPETHLPPGFIQYNLVPDPSQMNTRIQPSNNYGIPLELDFNRLSLSAPPPPPLSANIMAAAPPVNGFGRGSINRGSSSTNMSPGANLGFSPYAHMNPQFSNGDIQRMRIEQMRSFMHGRNLEISNYESAYAYNNIIPQSNRNGFDSYRSRSLLSFSGFEDLRGKILQFAEDPCGSQYLQNTFEMCTEAEMTQLLLVIISNQRNFKDLCMHFHGTRVVQKLIECLTTAEQRSMLMSVIKHITFALTKSSCGSHVIQHCLQYFPSEHTKHILNVVADNCVDIATDRSGCCVIQQCVNHAYGEPGERLITEITSNAQTLSEDRYGNYVVQHILCKRIPHVSANIIAQLAGSHVALSMNKYGSNVVEKCLESKVDQVFDVINEIIHSPDFLTVLRDAFGNYVAQAVLREARGPIRESMVSLIQAHSASLHSHPHGKNVLAAVKGMNLRE